MNSISHKLLANYLTAHFLRHLPTIYKLAFTFGCSEPDKNPATYLKGSLRGQWLQGHNWINTRGYILATGERLKHKESFAFKDYYTLGRIIHYVADAFTYAHNTHFCQGIAAHRSYEKKLEAYIKQVKQRPLVLKEAGMDTLETALTKLRLSYLRIGSKATTDYSFICAACCEVMCHFTPAFKNA